MFALLSSPQPVDDALSTPDEVNISRTSGAPASSRGYEPAALWAIDSACATYIQAVRSLDALQRAQPRPSEKDIWRLVCTAAPGKLSARTTHDYTTSLT